jgi:hypothetical protein
MQHVTVLMFGELLECNMSLLGCLENCWSATCHCSDVWRITGTQHVIVVVLENCWNATCHCSDVWRISGMQCVIFVVFGELLERHIAIVVMFGELLERNMPLLGCLENYWNAKCHCWDVWRITGMQHVIVGMFSDTVIFIQTVCAN